MKNAIEEIKTFIPISQAIEFYTGEHFKKNKIQCPIHNERTASFTVYPNTNTFYCFGCGAYGSLIDFVMILYNLDIKAAINKISSDFGMLITPNKNEQLKRNKLVNELIAKRNKKIERDRQQKEHYWRLFDMVLKYEKHIKQYRPLSASAEPHALFVEALQNIEYARHLLSCAENERILNE